MAKTPKQYKEESKERRELIKHELDKLGSFQEIAKQDKHLSVPIIEAWIEDAWIEPDYLPALLVIAKKRNVSFSFDGIVKPRRKTIHWSDARRRLENLFIALGGKNAIAEEVNVNPETVGLWGYIGNIPRWYHGPFSRLCQKQYKKYTGRSIVATDYLLLDEDDHPYIDLDGLCAVFEEL